MKLNCGLWLVSEPHDNNRANHQSLMRRLSDDERAVITTKHAQLSTGIQVGKLQLVSIKISHGKQD